MVKVELIEKVEGEAYLHYRYKKGKIRDVRVEFLPSRGIEKILKGRVLSDALVITPRVCGICGHSHLIATSLALEKLANFTPSPKANSIRTVTLSCEIIQNHLKWFYLTILPLLNQLGFKEVSPFEAINYASKIQKVIALFGGQYPHTSYSLAGGVACDPSFLELLKAKRLTLEVKEFFNAKLLEEIKSFKEFRSSKGLLKETYLFLAKRKLLKVGKGKESFLTSSKRFKKGKGEKTRIRFIQEEKDKVLYKGEFVEVGALARNFKKGVVREVYRKFKDTLFSRIFARVFEIGVMLEKILKELETIDLSQNSYLPVNLNLSGYGESIVEAPRGCLIHKVTAKNGIITNYEIITPTQLNLSNGTASNPSILQQAILNLKDPLVAQLVFRSFDVCSVCSTH
ncbi:MAG: nickel-dependent hydrogenase large subunit [Epsilonproteobacteria bacterium]|nr:nickel-dependent hydrogenase large subunit [Campylobacterota bacterium]